jgi:predicted MPP superfamily phosphohydrolase
MLKNKVFILVAFLGLTLFAYGYYIESNWLEVTHHQIILNKKSKK